jgi:hypothetical protein
VSLTSWRRRKIAETASASDFKNMNAYILEKIPDARNFVANLLK